MIIIIQSSYANAAHVKESSALFADLIGSSLSACNDPTKQMDFKVSIQRLGNGQLVLVSEVTNFSKTPKKLNDIDIDNQLHNSLGLTTVDGRSGEYLPLDDTITYSINKQLDPQELSFPVS